jgi:hypothetical protein
LLNQAHLSSFYCFTSEKSEREIAVFCFLCGSDLTRQTGLAIGTLRLNFFDDIAGKNPLSGHVAPPNYD